MQGNLPNSDSFMFKWLLIISDNCLPVAVQSSEAVESKSLVLTFGDLLDELETVAAVPTQRDLKYEPKNEIESKQFSNNASQKLKSIRLNPTGSPWRAL